MTGPRHQLDGDPHEVAVERHVPYPEFCTGYPHGSYDACLRSSYCPRDPT